MTLTSVQALSPQPLYPIHKGVDLRSLALRCFVHQAYQRIGYGSGFGCKGRSLPGTIAARQGSEALAGVEDVLRSGRVEHGGERAGMEARGQ